MKDTKHRFEMFSFYDHTGIERHLEKMAERGWLLEKVGPLWTYRRIEPQKLTFSVCYFPKASQFDPEPSEGQETFYDFCRHSGWTLAAASAQMQIFYNQWENPVPIETDPVLEVEAIHRSAKKSVLIPHFLLIGAGVLEIALYIWQYWLNPINFLANASLLFASMAYIILFLTCTVELFGYFSWYAKAKQAAEQNEFIETKSHRLFQWVLLALVLINLVIWLAFMSYSAKWLMMTILSMLSVLVMVVLVNFISWVLKRWKIPAKTNRNITYLASVILSIVTVSVVIYGTISTFAHGTGSSKKTFEYDGQTITLRQDELPLMLEDLLDIDQNGYAREKDDYRSFLLAKLQFRQYPRLIDRTFPDLPRLEYTVILVKAPSLYNLCRNTLLSQYEDDLYWNRFYAPLDAALWGAEEAYQVTDAEYGPWDLYLLCYPDRFVTIEFDWTPTPEQMALVGERLGNGTLS